MLLNTYDKYAPNVFPRILPSCGGFLAHHGTTMDALEEALQEHRKSSDLYTRMSVEVGPFVVLGCSMLSSARGF